MMKNRIIPPLMSALILPGAGQVYNGRIARGLALMGAATLLFIIALVRFTMDLSQALANAGRSHQDLGVIAQAAVELREKGFGAYLALGVAFALVWAYSVVDAAIGAAKAPPALGPRA